MAHPDDMGASPFVLNMEDDIQLLDWLLDLDGSPSKMDITPTKAAVTSLNTPDMGNYYDFGQDGLGPSDNSHIEGHDLVTEKRCMLHSAPLLCKAPHHHFAARSINCHLTKGTLPDYMEQDLSFLAEVAGTLMPMMGGGDIPLAHGHAMDRLSRHVHASQTLPV